MVLRALAGLSASLRSAAKLLAAAHKTPFLLLISHNQCPDEIVPDKSTSTTLRNTPLTYKHDSAGSFSITGNQLNRVYLRARDYAKLYWSTCPVLFRPDTGHNIQAAS
jgi:hypothetical protein